MGRYIRPDGTSAEVQPGLGVIAPRNLTARPMARPTGAQIAPQLAAQRARAAAEAQRQAEEEQARRRMYDECRRRGDYICEEAELGSGLSSEYDPTQNLNCGHNEYVACEASGYNIPTCDCAPMSPEDIADRDAAARRQEQQQQRQQQQQQARQRQQQANIAALARVRPRPATAMLSRVQRTTPGRGGAST